MAETAAPRNDHATLTRGPVGPTLFRLAGSMMIGFVAGAAFNIADTYFVGKLGTEALAAMGFTFPIVMTVFSLTMGIGVGIASVCSRTIGAGRMADVHRLTFQSLFLGLTLTVVFVLVGIVFLEPLLKLLGAGSETLPLAKRYMRIWLAGIVVLVIPILGNNVIRATGDTLSPSMIMTLDLGLNIFLDPVLIFGWGPIPAMGIEGAAIATVFCRGLALAASLYILIFRKRVLVRDSFTFEGMWRSWKSVLYIGLPVAATNLLMPFAGGVVTRMISSLGTPFVAALSAGMRMERCIGIPLIAMGVSMVPFVGQNWGAREFERVRRARSITYLFCLLWGSLCLIGLRAVSANAAGLFSDDSSVIEALTVYLWIMPAALAFRGMSHAANGAMNAVNRPLDSSLVTVVRLVALQLPLAVLGMKLGGFIGILLGLVISEALGALGGAAWCRILCRRLARRAEES